jgi:hypothetical protein
MLRMTWRDRVITLAIVAVSVAIGYVLGSS